MMRQLFLLLLIAAATFHCAFAQDKVAIVNVTIIDGTGHPPRNNATVIVQRGKIVAITVTRKKPPRGAKIIEGAGKFLIPGLWNNAQHAPDYGDAKASLLSLVSYGITTVRDMGAPLDDVVRLRAATASGALIGPRLFIAGPLMRSPYRWRSSLIFSARSKRVTRSES